MKKKDYEKMESLYKEVCETHGKYQKALSDYIENAFCKHGNVFELKCEIAPTWKDGYRSGDVDILNDLPYYLNIGVDDDGLHEIHIYRVRLELTDFGYQSIVVDGFDWNDSLFVMDWDAYTNTEDLETISSFMNRVLEQELNVNNKQ